MNIYRVMETAKNIGKTSLFAAGAGTLMAVTRSNLILFPVSIAVGITAIAGNRILENKINEMGNNPNINRDVGIIEGIKIISPRAKQGLEKIVKTAMDRDLLIEKAEKVGLNAKEQMQFKNLSEQLRRLGIQYGPEIKKSARDYGADVKTQTGLGYFIDMTRKGYTTFLGNKTGA